MTAALDLAFGWPKENPLFPADGSDSLRASLTERKAEDVATVTRLAWREVWWNLCLIYKWHCVSWRIYFFLIWSTHHQVRKAPMSPNGPSSPTPCSRKKAFWSLRFHLFLWSWEDKTKRGLDRKLTCVWEQTLLKIISISCLCILGFVVLWWTGNQTYCLKFCRQVLYYQTKSPTTYYASCQKLDPESRATPFWF